LQRNNYAHRQRVAAILIGATIPLGLMSRMKSLPMPNVVRLYGGDTLSATCIFFGVSFLAPRKPIATGGSIGLFICVLIELQQLLRFRWLVRLRDDTAMGILLGHGFLWSDIALYAVGTLIGMAVISGINVWTSRSRSRSRSRSTDTSMDS
jgi:hypothetical protein